MKRYILLLFLNIYSILAIGQGVRINFNDSHITVDTNWFAKQGEIDKDEISSLNLKGWDEIDSSYEKNSAYPVIWYKNYITFPDSVRSKVFTVKTLCTGKNDVYIDGQLVQSVSPEHSILRNYVIPSVFVPGKDSLHVVVIRSEREVHERAMEDQPTLMLFDFEKEIRREVLTISIATAFMIFMMTAFLVLGFFHLILFLFYKEERSNFFLGLFCLLFGIFFMVSMGKLVTEQRSGFHDLFNGVHFLLPLLPVFVLGLFHSVFYNRLRPYFWYALGTFVICRTLEFFDLIDGLSALLAFIVFVDLARVVIVAARKKKPGSRIIGLGLLITILAVPLILAAFIHSSSNGLLSAEVWIITGALGSIGLLLLSIPLTMSFHFASSFAKTNRQLKQQINQIEELNAKTLAQEQEKKNILQQQKYNLEVQVEERTREVMIQKKQLEEKNKNITDSINYARKIQHAILHSEDELKLIMPESFILFLPKDIVSGDFYWFHKKNGKIYIVCADCTGHGVPGAFMSMIGHTILDDIINDNEEVHPSEVLTQLNERVRDILKQDHGSETRDGMDITFCKLDPLSNMMEISSAMRPVYILRDNSFLEIKPDKFSIGGLYQEQKRFTTSMFQLQKNDMVYFFTDGYADQFGGEKGKKFMLKKFQNLLGEIHKADIGSQKKQLHEAHLNWKQHHDQVDDILVIGIRV